MAGSGKGRFASGRGTAVAASAAVFAVAGVAMAAIPGGDGVIHGCYTNTGGHVRVIDPATTTCGSSETSLDWNQTGPKGDTGATGPAGPSGSNTMDAIWSLGPLSSTTDRVTMAKCPSGTAMTGGGGRLIDEYNVKPANVALVHSAPYSVDIWQVRAKEMGLGTTVSWKLDAVVMCIGIS